MIRENRNAERATPEASACGTRPEGMIDFDEPQRFKAVTRTNVSSQPEWELLDPEIREGVEVVGKFAVDVMA